MGTVTQAACPRVAGSKAKAPSASCADYGTAQIQILWREARIYMEKFTRHPFFFLDSLMQALT